MKEIKTFDEIILHEKGEGFKSLTGKPVILDFYADWCGPCKISSPSVERITDEHAEVDAFKVDISESPELAAVFNIRSIPTFIIITPDGKVATKLGWETEEAFETFVQNSITSDEEN